MNQINWQDEFPGAVIVCDAKGIILYLNQKACKTYAKDGGAELVGKSVLDCHPESARKKLEALLKNQGKNTYTIEKNGIKKLIHQSPWYKEGKYQGMVEFSLEIPFEMAHFVRGKT